jgi:DNA-binding transcriptional LysR family regulator
MEASLTNAFCRSGIRLADTLPPTSTALLNRLLARGKLRHVQVLLKLAELGSLQRTADAIGTTQSSVTQTLAYVEGLLETQLFYRHARGVRPTSACSDLLPVARQVMHGTIQIAEVAAAGHRRGHGVVRLVASAAAINGMLVGRLTEFSERAPSIEVHLREAEGEDQLLAIARGEVDLVACRQPLIVPEGWEFVPLVEDEIVVVCAAGHPLAGARAPRPADLARQLWAVAPSGTAARESFDAFASQSSEPLRFHTLVTRNEALLVDVLQKRQAMSMLPLSFVRHLIQTGELEVVKTAKTVVMPALGLLEPAGVAREATLKLSAFLKEATRQKPPSRRQRPIPAV